MTTVLPSSGRGAAVVVVVELEVVLVDVVAVAEDVVVVGAATVVVVLGAAGDSLHAVTSSTPTAANIAPRRMKRVSHRAGDGGSGRGSGRARPWA